MFYFQSFRIGDIKIDEEEDEEEIIEKRRKQREELLKVFEMFVLFLDGVFHLTWFKPFRGLITLMTWFFIIIVILLSPESFL